MRFFFYTVLFYAFVLYTVLSVRIFLYAFFLYVVLFYAILPVPGSFLTRFLFYTVNNPSRDERISFLKYHDALILVFYIFLYAYSVHFVLFYTLQFSITV